MAENDPQDQQMGLDASQMISEFKRIREEASGLAQTFTNLKAAMGGVEESANQLHEQLEEQINTELKLSKNFRATGEELVALSQKMQVATKAMVEGNAAQKHF